MQRNRCLLATKHPPCYLDDLARQLASKGSETFLQLHRNPFLLVRSYPARPGAQSALSTVETSLESALLHGAGLATAITGASDFPPLCSAVELVKRNPSTPTSKITLGRSRSCDVVIDTPGVSRLHLVFALDGAGRNYVADWNSTNGTYLNRRRLKTREATPISSGDRLVIHRHHFEFLEAGALARLLVSLFGLSLF